MVDGRNRYDDVLARPINRGCHDYCSGFVRSCVCLIILVLLYICSVSVFFFWSLFACQRQEEKGIS